MSPPAVVIVSYDTRELLRRCLASVTADHPSRVVVVDNGSEDGSAAMVAREFPSVTLDRDPSNPGFGAAANRGMARCDEPYALLLNADTEVTSGGLARLAEYLDAHPKCAVLGPRVVGMDGRLQPSAFPPPTPLHVFLAETPLGPLGRRLPFLGRWYLRAWAHDRPRRVPWLRGAALAVRTSAFAEVGGFDPGYRMYFEETDLCLRLEDAGWEVHYAPVTDVRHAGGASTSRHPGPMRVLYYESLRRLYRRHYGRAARGVLEAVLWLTLAPRAAARWLAGTFALSGRRRAALRESAAADWRSLRRSRAPGAGAGAGAGAGS